MYPSENKYLGEEAGTLGKGLASVRSTEEREIESELSALRSHIGVLDEYVTKLSIRLEPIIRPSPVESSDPEEYGPSTTVGKSIRESRTIVQRNIGHISYLLDTIQI